jgi:hypothetical protein
MKNGVFWDVTQLDLCSSQCNIPEDAILHSHCREKLKPYITCYNDKKDV